MLPASSRHSGVGTQPSVHHCNPLNHSRTLPRVVNSQSCHRHASGSCGDLSTSVRVLQQAGWAWQQPCRCSPIACQASRQSSSWCSGAGTGGLGPCLQAARHLPANSSTAQRRLQYSRQLLVVALDRDGQHSKDCEDYEQPPEAGVLPQNVERLRSNKLASTSAPTPSSTTKPIVTNPIITSNSSTASSKPNSSHITSPTPASTSSRSSSPAAAASAGAAAAPPASKQEFGGAGRALYPPAERSQIQDSWDTLMRWSKSFSRRQAKALSPIEATDKVVVFGGGSFGTAMGTSLAIKKSELDVVLLLRDPYLCKDINTQHRNTKYLPDFALPQNVRATTDAAEAIAGASYAVHAVPVQHSRSFLTSIKDVLPKNVPIICVSKGLEVGSGCMMSEVIPSALGRRQPAVFLSGPSFAKEVMQGRPTGVVAACKDAALGREVQELFASPNMRVNTSTDVTGVEICGALKNVLAIAAGIVEGLDLGHNALAALIAQGCAEIRWLSQKVGAKPATISGLSGLGDIMLTCYGDLSRNRSVGVRLGRGEKLGDILASSSQVAEGVATAGVVVGLARKYRVSLPVLTAVAQVLDSNLSPAEAVAAVMNLPQIEEH